MNQETKEAIEKAAKAEEIYEPKYGGKDHSGYDTMMKYEINSIRSDCFEKGAEFGFNLAIKQAEILVEALENIEVDYETSYQIALTALNAWRKATGE